jgi:hypothetical protein
MQLIELPGTPPANPLSEVICGDRRNGRDTRDRDMGEIPIHNVGSVCDIPLDKIAAFCHNAV